jgi:hypothetical protein
MLSDVYVSALQDLVDYLHARQHGSAADIRDIEDALAILDGDGDTSIEIDGLVITGTRLVDACYRITPPLN